MHSERKTHAWCQKRTNCWDALAGIVTLITGVSVYARIASQSRSACTHAPEIVCILQARVHALATDRRMDVGGIACDESGGRAGEVGIALGCSRVQPELREPRGVLGLELDRKDVERGLDVPKGRRLAAAAVISHRHHPVSAVRECENEHKLLVGWVVAEHGLPW